jgi:thiamine pyrophosphokinase
MRAVGRVLSAAKTEDVVSYASLNPAGAASCFHGGTVLMLNSPRALPSFFDKLWTKDAFRACADGASNRLYHSAVSPLAPHIIVGDLDSARPQVLRHYEAEGTVVVRRGDQNSTDMEKLLGYSAVEDARMHRTGRTAVLGGLGGLLSHQFANMNASLNACRDPRFLPLVFLDEHEVCLVIRPGRTRFVRVDSGVHCALVPLFGPVGKVTTRGLQWDLYAKQLAFGSLISTSNKCVNEEVIVDTDAHFLWMFERRID